MKEAFIIAVFLGLSGIIVFVLNQFVVMPWENIKLGKLENPHLVVKKKERLLQVFDGERLIKTYEIVLGFAPEGDKEIAGDGKTPEGEFYVFVKNPNSKYHLSLGVSYPSNEDANRGLKENLISEEERETIIKANSEKQTPLQNTKLGGEIYIHGGGTITDWTHGCIALRNEEMKELFDAIPVGVPVKIEP